MAGSVTTEESPSRIAESRDHPSTYPRDEHNREWLEHVRPADWKNPSPASRYNMLVVGAGPAGLIVAAAAAGLGAKVALIEKHLLGGDCLNVGCVPSKALLRAAKAAADVRGARHFGVEAGQAPRVDFPRVMERLRERRAGLSHHDSAERFRGLGIDVFLGEGRFISRDTFEIEGAAIRFSRACIATGARAVELPIPGLAESGALTNETVFTLTEQPGRIAVIGAGPIGCELSQAFARLGSRVTLLESMRQILPREDRDAAALVQASLQRDGVETNCCSEILSVRREGEDRVLELGNKENPKYRGELRADAIILGAGRAPNVENLGLEAAGVHYDRQGIKVSDQLATTNPAIFAAGDVCSAFKFTHAADAMARIVVRNALFFGRAKASALVIPWCTYTDPEIAHVGAYPVELEEKGVSYRTFEIPLGDVDRAVLDGETEGFAKIHVDGKSDRILGATIVAAHAGDMIATISLAMTSGLGMSSIANTIFPYPTQAEVIKKAGDAYNRTRLSPAVKRLFELILRWRC
jgi:pyruvate/2-oxoglutarate dehydrogenase complex dihydrolipoamide dehydrogenase (E3) component